MAAKSKRAKFHAITKRENTQLKRMVVEAQQAQARATALVLGMLVQSGGDLTLSQATTNTMNKDIARMGYQIVPTPEGLVKVVLVMQEPEVAEEVPQPSSIVLTDAETTR